MGELIKRFFRVIYVNKKEDSPSEGTAYYDNVAEAMIEAANYSTWLVQEHEEFIECYIDDSEGEEV